LTRHITRKLPPSLTEHARAFLSGDRQPAQPKGAATVVLLRPAETGPEVYLLRRHRGMAFAGGMYAFPGGTVDDRDFDSTASWAGPTPKEWGHRLRCSAAEAQALVCAAVRETFEESGVLLAGASPESIVRDTTADDWETDRVALVDRSLSFVEFLGRRALGVRSDLLRAWAHWITPEFEPRRYDTRFFLAALPQGQRTRDVSGEADRVVWMRPSAATAAVDDGAMEMLPPTYVTLQEIADFPTVRAALAAAASRDIVTVTPGVELIDGEGFLTVAGDGPS
jgi:8-oxo-dGTP pyrophosphatase MutT (NUDIX family)